MGRIFSRSESKRKEKKRKEKSCSIVFNKTTKSKFLIEEEVSKKNKKRKFKKL